jgi:hypothetical protein
MADTRMRQRLRQYRLEREVEDAWHKLVKGQNYRHIERGWVGRFDGIPSDNFTAWMTFDFGQCGVDPRKLEEAQMTPPNSPNSSPELTEVEPDGLLRALPASVTSFIVAIQDRTPNGEWIAVQYHPDGDWSVAHEALATKNELPSVPMTSSPITDEKAKLVRFLMEDHAPHAPAHREHAANWLADRILAMRSLAPPVMGMEEMVRWREGGTIFDALCRIRCRNAADFSGKLTARESEVYDKAVLACFAEIEKALSTPLVTGRE